MGWGDFWGHGTTSEANFSSRLRRMRVSPSGALPQGQFFPAPSAQASITTTNVAQKVANIRVGDHSHIHSRQRCHEEFLPTGLLRPGGDYHLVIAGKGYYHPVNLISQALDRIIIK